MLPVAVNVLVAGFEESADCVDPPPVIEDLAIGCRGAVGQHRSAVPTAEIIRERHAAGGNHEFLNGRSHLASAVSFSRCQAPLNTYASPT